MSQFIILLCGFYALGLTIFHLFFWKILRWKVELQKLGEVNRAVMQIMNIQLMVYFTTIAVMCFYFKEELLESNIGNFMLFATSLFCFVRFIQQFIFLRINNWQIHLLTAVFGLGTLLFLLPIIP